MDAKTHRTVADFFKKLYVQTDAEMARYNPVCQRGCHWCCYQSIEILNWEEPLIVDYIREKMPDKTYIEVRKNLKKWFTFFGEATQGKTQLTMHDAFQRFNQQQANEKIPCPFLFNRECSIYEVRPLCCRCHISIGNPSDCQSNPLLNSLPETDQYRKKIIADIASHLPTTLRLLPFVAAPLFNLEKYTKPIRYNKIKTT